VSAEIYFQFPLPLLAFGADVETRLRTVVAYAIVTTGRGKYCTMSREEAVEIAKQIPLENRPQGLHLDRADHISIALGRKILGVVNGTVADDVDRFSTAEEFLRADKEAHGPAPTVRVLSRYAWEVLNGTGMDYRKFSVLCAIYCVIGAKAYPVLITRDRIRAAALGYKSARMLFDEFGKLTEAGERLLAQRIDGARPLTLNQVRSTIKKLNEAGHFAKASPNARQTYFSHRMTAVELRSRLLQWKTRPVFTGNLSRSADQELQAKIKATNQANGKSPRDHHFNSAPTLIDEKAVETTAESPHHASTATAPQDHHCITTDSTAFTETSSQKLISVETDLTETGSARAREEAPAVKQEGTAEAKPAPKFTQPALEDVSGFFADSGWERYAAEWFDEYGEEDWTGRDWKKASFPWLMDRLKRAKRP
jgi:hypothetical protein